MSVIYPVTAAVLQAVSFTFDKVTLSVKRMTFKAYNGVSFPLIFIFTLFVFFIFRPTLSPQMLELKVVGLITLSIVLIAITNLIFYRALKSDLLSEMQTLSLLRGVPLIIFAGLIFQDERNFVVIGLALLAVAAIVWSHWEHHHFRVAKKTWTFLLWTLAISPFGGVISKIILQSWDPITLQLVRDGVIALVFIPLFYKSIVHVPKKAILPLLAANLLTSVAWILYFLSIQVSGIVQTVLIFSLQPLLVYFSSVFFLKEKIHWKKLIAFLVILAAIAVSQIVT